MLKAIQSVRLIGVGLMGGSIARAVRSRWKSIRLTAMVRTQARRQQLVQTGLFNEVETDAGRAKWRNELVLLCTPPESIPDLCREMAQRCDEGCVISDIASVKNGIIRSFIECQAEYGVECVGSHPMAGSEKSGFEHSLDGLLNGAACIVTPTRLSSKAAVASVKAFWRGLGMRVAVMSPERHDHYLARSSHLVHLAASGLASYVLREIDPGLREIVCASGFRDTTRVASGDPDLWMEITRQNAGEISRALGGFAREMESLKAMIDRRDFAGVSRFLSSAKRRRDACVGHNGLKKAAGGSGSGE